MIDFLNTPRIHCSAYLGIDPIYYSMIWRFACSRKDGDAGLEAHDMPSGEDATLRME